MASKGVGPLVHSIPAFSVTWDYRCPFARNVHEHLIDAIESGASWDVTFVPFFLNQAHVTDGDVPAWEDPAHVPDLLSLEVGVAVRDKFPEHFLAVHRALFGARHDGGGDLRDRNTVSEALGSTGVDSSAVLAEVDRGWPREVARREHEDVVRRLDVFGVPTFILGDRAAFARLMDRSSGEGSASADTIARIVDLVAAHPELNELKQTRVAR